MKLENVLAFIFALILVGGVLAGCQSVVVPNDPIVVDGVGAYGDLEFDLGKDITTKTFSSDDELLNFIKDHESDNYYGYDNMLKGGMVLESAEMAVESVAMAVPTSVNVERDFSETNVQVTGVDEADIIKTDGDHIYTVSGNVLFIIKAYPGEDAEIVSTIKFENRPESLFIDGDTLAVFGNFRDNDYFKKVNFQPRSGMTYLNVYDVSDRVEPELVKEYKFEGGYFRGRMVDGYMYILTSTTPYARPVPMPVIFEDGVKSEMVVGDIHYFDINYRNPVFVNIHAINMDDSDELSSKTVVVEYSQNLYMSENNIYITYTESISEWELQKVIVMELLEPFLSDSDKFLIEKIKKVDNDILSRAEKDAKIFAVYETYMSGLTREEQDDLEDDAEKLLKEKLEEYKYFEFTVINKISVDKSEIKVVVNGKVPGHVINQFSMDEFDDIFRIATTVNSRWSRFDSGRSESVNNIYTLNSDLEILDELEDLAEGERIFSTRFMGDKLYMVTFKQVDPFFVIDLSNPNEIKALGELKIPGFSRYLHPYDENTIIGIGKDASESGRTRGLKISLFDVSDVSDPKEVAQYVAESRYSGTSAEYEHKAFLFSKEKNLLVIPVYSYDYDDTTQDYNGAFVFDISKDEIELRGLIDHSQGKQRYYQPAVERSLYIEELLYTKSKDLLRINQIEDLEKVKNVELKYSDPGIPVY
ncbi:MAG: beta-propeller domain-containing protein [Nanoarchaeota archaeon]|nr:beta-propeller domain-containing protein [Nanoarchaeota archaeon]